MKQIIFTATLIGALFIGQFANAQGRHYGHKHYKKSQGERIQDGIRNGSISKNEAMRLRMQQAKLRGYREMARADGRVNGKERRLMVNGQKMAAHNIYKARHNNRGRHYGHMHKGGKAAYHHKQYGNKGQKNGTWQFRDSRREGSWNVR